MCFPVLEWGGGRGERGFLNTYYTGTDPSKGLGRQVGSRRSFYNFETLKTDLMLFGKKVPEYIENLHLK